MKWNAEVTTSGNRTECEGSNSAMQTAKLFYIRRFQYSIMVGYNTPEANVVYLHIHVLNKDLLNSPS